MGIIGTHALLYTSEPEAVRAIFRDVFGWPHVNAGEGWLIFALPPAEIGVRQAGAGAVAEQRGAVAVRREVVGERSGQRVRRRRRAVRREEGTGHSQDFIR